jgi:hypothetical protein
MKNISVIPKGCYCYDKQGVCPYWSTNPTKHYQENGYCAFLERGDWEMNNDVKWVTLGEDIKHSANEIGIPMSLLWDQCKECGINEVDDEENA